MKCFLKFRQKSGKLKVVNFKIVREAYKLGN